VVRGCKTTFSHLLNFHEKKLGPQLFHQLGRLRPGAFAGEFDRGVDLRLDRLADDAFRLGCVRDGVGSEIAGSTDCQPASFADDRIKRTTLFANRTLPAIESDGRSLRHLVVLDDIPLAKNPTIASLLCDYRRLGCCVVATAQYLAAVPRDMLEGFDYVAFTRDTKRSNVEKIWNACDRPLGTLDAFETTFDVVTKDFSLVVDVRNVIDTSNPTNRRAHSIYRYRA